MPSTSAAATASSRATSPSRAGTCWPSTPTRRVEERVKPRWGMRWRSLVDVRRASFETVGELPASDFIYAGFALPFCDAGHFPYLWADIRDALRPGAVFAGELFGPDDEWFGRAGMNFHDRARCRGDAGRTRRRAARRGQPARDVVRGSQALARLPRGRARLKPAEPAERLDGLKSAELAERLRSQHPEQRELLRRLRARRGREHEQALRLVLGEEHLAVEFDRAELRVDERLVVLEPLGDLVPCPRVPTNSGLAFCSARDQFARRVSRAPIVP